MTPPHTNVKEKNVLKTHWANTTKYASENTDLQYHTTYNLRKDAFRHAGLEKTTLKISNTSSISVLSMLSSSQLVMSSAVMK